MTYASTVLSYSPSLFWRTQESSGTSFADSSGNSRSGTKNDNVTLNQTDSPITTDAAARSLAFDGSDSWLSSSYNPFSGSMTFGGWAKRTNTSGQMGIFGGSSASLSPCLYLANGGSGITWAADMSSSTVSFDNGWPSTGVWHMWMLTFNNTSKDVILYIDGVKNGATKNAGVGYNASPGNFQLSGRGTFQNIWLGKLAETFIVPGLLVGSDALTIFNAATSTPSIDAYWTCT